jgi:hypothetical protein
MAKKRKPKKATKKAAGKKGAKKMAAKKRAGATAMVHVRYCYLLTPDPNWIERCEYGPDGRCNVNCTMIPASQVPKSAAVRSR